MVTQPALRAQRTNRVYNSWDITEHIFGCSVAIRIFSHLFMGWKPKSVNRFPHQSNQLVNYTLVRQYPRWTCGLSAAAHGNQFGIGVALYLRVCRELLENNTLSIALGHFNYHGTHKIRPIVRPWNVFRHGHDIHKFKYFGIPNMHMGSLRPAPCVNNCVKRW